MPGQNNFGCKKALQEGNTAEQKHLARSDKMITASPVWLRRRGHRGFNLTAGTTKRLFLLTTVLGVCLGLSACAPLAGAVSDAWPTWAGGMPKDVPPRPGAPGYEEFIAHQQRQDVAPPNAAPNTAAAPGTTAVVAPAGTAPGTTAVAVPVTAAPGPTAAVRSPAGGYPQPPPQAPLPPAYARPDDRSATQGGLY